MGDLRKCSYSRTALSIQLSYAHVSIVVFVYKYYLNQYDVQSKTRYNCSLENCWNKQPRHDKTVGCVSPAIDNRLSLIKIIVIELSVIMIICFRLYPKHQGYNHTNYYNVLIQIFFKCWLAT